jgi:hypothetical protein
MKRLVPLLAIFVIILLFFGSCYYDSEESLYPTLNTSCDTTNVTFSGKIFPILSNNCLSCHSNSAAPVSGNSIAIENYADVKARAVSISGAINQTGSNSPMPKNGSKLKACLITQFDIWVRNGTPNN